MEDLKQNQHLAKNLRLLRKRRGVTQQELAETLKFTRSQIAGYETTINPNLDALIKLADFFSISIDVLLRENLCSFSEFRLSEIDRGIENYTNGRNLRILTTKVTDDDSNLVEVVPLKAKAGYLAGFADPEFIADLPALSIPFINKQKKHRVFEIDGDSMPPIAHGSYVVCAYLENWNQVKDGKRYVLLTESEGVVFKVLYNKLAETGKILLVSTNPDYAPYEVLPMDVKEIWEYKLSIGVQ